MAVWWSDHLGGKINRFFLFCYFTKHRFWLGLQYQGWIPSCTAGLRASQESSWLPLHTPLNTSSLVGGSCGLRVQHRIKGTNVLSPPPPPSAVKASQQDFSWVLSQSVWWLSSNRMLPSSCGCPSWKPPGWVSWGRGQRTKHSSLALEN